MTSRLNCFVGLRRSAFRLAAAGLLLGWSVLAFPQAETEGLTAKLTPTEVALLEQVEQFPQRLLAGSLTKEQIPNPHWDDNGCLACHTDAPARGSLSLRNNDALTNCRDCHDSLTEQTHIHAVGMQPPSAFLGRMPASFKATLTAHGNKINCLTCHDVILQCRKSSSYMEQINRDFLRDAPYGTRTGICFQCHDQSKYAPLNPHDQITDDGRLLKDKCLICHLKVPQELDNGQVIDTEFYLATGWSALCINCHRQIPHPSGNLSFIKKGDPNHLVKPQEKYRQQMAKMTAENNVYLPLETGTEVIYCGTCHNPHERGVLKNKKLAMGADSEHRLRIVPICRNCHNV